jgi:rhodanese-related sulfurtransferase
MATIPRYMTREALALLLRESGAGSSSVAVIDVRDEDRVGGHILGSRHVPSTSLDYTMPELVRLLRDKEKVVFHCALSQQRGPRAARRYMEERERTLEKEEKMQQMGKDDQPKSERKAVQEVYVLDGGFARWQEL